MGLADANSFIKGTHLVSGKQQNTWMVMAVQKAPNLAEGRQVSRQAEEGGEGAMKRSQVVCEEAQEMSFTLKACRSLHVLY